MVMLKENENWLNVLHWLADEASYISLKYFRQHLDIESKANQTPVTIADKEIELILRSLIMMKFPEHQIIGEEFENQEAIDDRYCWVIDPIDGTVAFSCGKPTFTTLIALLEDGKPIASIIDQPFLGERYCGLHDFSSLKNDSVIATNQIITEIADARLNATTPYMFKTIDEQTKFEKLHKQVKLTSFGGDAYSFGLLASGNIDIIMEADLAYYDVAALVPIITGAGGIITDWQGKQICREFNGQCLASANTKLHTKILELINN